MSAGCCSLKAKLEIFASKTNFLHLCTPREKISFSLTFVGEKGQSHHVCMVGGEGKGCLYSKCVLGMHVCVFGGCVLGVCMYSVCLYRVCPCICVQKSLMPSSPFLTLPQESIPNSDGTLISNSVGKVGFFLVPKLSFLPFLKWEKTKDIYPRRPLWLKGKMIFFYFSCL